MGPTDLVVRSGTRVFMSWMEACVLFLLVLRASCTLRGRACARYLRRPGLSAERLSRIRMVLREPDVSDRGPCEVAG